MKATALFLTFVWCGLVSFAQDMPVTGIVRSSVDSLPISSASVLVKGTSKGTVSDADGVFSISVPSNAILIISALGFTEQEVPVNSRQRVEVMLRISDQSELSEVVVTTALGIKKQQKTLGYAVQEVNGETMAKTKVATPISALTGKVAGLNISNTTDLFRNPGISLRGRKPLIVIDGIPDPNADPYKINADDIESISVLKGTAAGALYGALGVNGAIMYTTKKGRKGKLNVEFNSSTMFQPSYTVIPKVQTQ